MLKNTWLRVGFGAAGLATAGIALAISSQTTRPKEAFAQTTPRPNAYTDELSAAGAAAAAPPVAESPAAAMTVQTAAAVAPRNTGKTPGGPFISDFRLGYDGEAHYLADYVMKEDWIGVANDPQLAVFGSDGLTLNLEKKKTRGVPYRGSELQQGGFYGYGRYEVIMRAAKGSGVVTGFFTHTAEFFDDPHDEIDFEFLGLNTREVEINYFTNGKSWGGEVIELPFDAAEEFHLYAFEWTHDSIRWFIDGQMVHEAKAGSSKTPLPRASGRVILNIWAARGDAQGWTGDATTEKTSATFLCMSHVPVGQTGPQCSDADTF